MPGNRDNYLFLTVVVLGLLPVLLELSSIYLRMNRAEIFAYFFLAFNNGNLGSQLISLFQYSVFAVMLVIYPLYPSPFSTEKYFSKRDPQSVITEYDILRKVVYVLFPFFIFALSYLIVERLPGDNPLRDLIIIGSGKNAILSYLIITSMAVTVFIVTAALLKIVFLTRGKHFRFYFAKTLIKLISVEKDEVNKIRNLIKALNSYNKYIRKTLGLEINDLKKIYSKIISDVNIDTNKSIEELSRAFEDHDKLKAIKCLSTLLNVTDSEQSSSDFACKSGDCPTSKSIVSKITKANAQLIKSRYIRVIGIPCKPSKNIEYLLF